MSSAASALFYLCSRSVANLMRARLRRLKQPKYVFGAVLALAYLYFLFIYPTLIANRDAGNTLNAPEQFVTLFALMMLLFCVLSWVWWRKRTVLQLTDAEIAFLLPGPISHAALVHYHLLRGQAGMLVSAVIFTLVSQNWESIASPLPVRLFGWWLLMAVFYLYVSASGFTLTRLHNRGLVPWQRQLLMLVLLALVGWLINVLDPALRLPTLDETSPPPAFSAYLHDQASSGTLYWLLLPLRALLAHAGHGLHELPARAVAGAGNPVVALPVGLCECDAGQRRRHRRGGETRAHARRLSQGRLARRAPDHCARGSVPAARAWLASHRVAVEEPVVDA